MNIQRYLMPVIVAASLHGTLVFLFGKNPPPPPPIKDTPLVIRDPVPVDITAAPPEEDTGGESGGSPSPLPPSVEPPPTPSREDIFTISVKENATPIRPVLDLPTIPKEGFNYSGEATGPGTGLGHGPIGWEHLDRAPRAIVQTPPVYPATMRSSAISGSVMVEFVVDTSGRVISANAVKSSDREFADPAVRAVLKWRFDPGTVNGRRVNFRMAVPIEFNAER